MTDPTVRVRFAPSPTGPLHIGGMRTALFNYLFARHNHGKFILRIEDTDQTRKVEGAEEYIMESLSWAGLDIDEGIHEGGPYGPYRQSERKGLYREFAEKLVQAGKAYYAFDTPQQLEKLRKNAESDGKLFMYNSRNRKELDNSLNLPEDEVRRRIEHGMSYVIRFKIPENEEVVFHDVVREEVRVNSSTLDDKVLFKSDGMPTYHLANVVDDHLMKISHVIRGEEWLPSTPLHVLLYKAFGWEKIIPVFAHIPLTLKPDGKGKLSKRDGEKYGFPVFPLNWKAPDGELIPGYRESGYFPEAFINILAFLGWNPGTEKELYSLDELIRIFSLDRIIKGGSRFDPGKARWFNHQYLQRQDNRVLAEDFADLLRKKGIRTDAGVLTRIVALVKERADFVHEFWDHSSFFFQRPGEYDEKVARKIWKDQTGSIMQQLSEILSGMDDFDRDSLENRIKSFAEDRELGLGKIMNPLRLCLVGSNKGPGLFEVMEILGRKEVVVRIKQAIQILGL